MILNKAVIPFATTFISGKKSLVVFQRNIRTIRWKLQGFPSYWIYFFTLSNMYSHFIYNNVHKIVQHLIWIIIVITLDSLLRFVITPQHSKWFFSLLLTNIYLLMTTSVIFNSKTGKRSSQYRGVTPWNGLSVGARDYSLEKFKKIKYVAGIVCNWYFCIYIFYALVFTQYSKLYFCR